MSTNETVEILSIYRDRLKSQYEKPGWNKWALFGALASLIWLFFSIVSENNLETKDSFKLLIILIFIEILISQFQAVINLSFSGKTKYIEFKKEVPNRALSLVYQIIIISLIIYYSKNYIQFPFKQCDIIYFGFLYFILVVTLLVPLVMMITYPFPQGKFNIKEGRWFKNLLLLLVIFVTCTCIYFLLFTIHNWKIYSMWKSSLIFFGFYWIISRLIETIQKNPLIDEIDYLIDEVIFNKMPADTALSNLKLIVVGLELKDAISPLLIEYFKIEKSVRDSISYINQIANKTKEETDQIKRKTLIDGLNTNIERFKNNEYAQIKKFLKKLSIRLVIYKTFDHDTNVMMQTIEQINNSTKDLEEQIQATSVLLSSINNEA